MKRFTLIVVGIFITLNCFSQTSNWLWARQATGIDLQEGVSIATDAFGNVYATGYYTSAITFGSITLPTVTGRAIFIVKYSSTGIVLWAQKAGGTSVDNPRGITTDTAGNVYVTGIFQSATIVFGTYTLVNVNPGTTYDVFTAKYSPTGTVLWAKSAGGNSNDTGNAIITDSSGSVYITGYFSSPSIIFDTDTLINTSTGDMFFVKYDTGGNLLWAKCAGGGSTNVGTSVRTDKIGNEYVTGSFFSSSIVFDTTVLVNAGGFDIFVVKYDTNGNVIWAKSYGGTGGDFAHSITTDSLNNIYVTGDYSSPIIVFNPDTLINVDNTVVALICSL